MVFHGGFSKGCRTCLKRRVKCDETKPICHRCIKSKKECLGYRDDNDLVFKNETAATVRKAQTSEFIWPNELLTPHPRTKSPSPSARGSSPLRISSEDLETAEANAVHHFIEHFVKPATGSDAAQGFLVSTDEIYRRAAPDSPLALAIVALALVAQNRLTSDVRLRRQARLRYGEAMRKVNQALNDPIESGKDEVLVAILMFAMIGSVLDTPTPLPQWLLHNTAAENLVRKRGKAMAESNTSLELLMRVRLQMAMSHAVRAIPTQDFIDESDPETLSWSDLPPSIRTNPIHILNSLLVPVGSLRARAEDVFRRPVDSRSLSGASELVQNCIEADCGILGWLLNVQHDWAQETIDDGDVSVRVSENEIIKPCPGVYGVHVYRDVWVANQYHTVRCFRAFLQAIILRCGAWLSSVDVKDLSANQMEVSMAVLGFSQLKTRDTLLEIINDSCRSVFYNLAATNGQVDRHKINTLHDMRPAVGAPFFLARPMFIANSALIIPESQQLWIKSIMRLIGDKAGIKFATKLSATPIGHRHPLFDVRPREGFV